MAAVWTNTLVMLNGPSFLSDTIFVWRKDNTLQKGSGEKRSQREHWWRVFSLFKFDFFGNQIMLRTSMIPSRQRAPQVASSLIAKLLRLNGPGQRWSKLEILSSKWKQNFCNFTAGFIRTSLFFPWQNRVVWVKPPLYRTSNQGFVKMDSNLFKQLIFSGSFSEKSLDRNQRCGPRTSRCLSGCQRPARVTLHLQLRGPDIQWHPMTLVKLVNKCQLSNDVQWHSYHSSEIGVHTLCILQKTLQQTAQQRRKCSSWSWHWLSNLEKPTNQIQSI